MRGQDAELLVADSFRVRLDPGSDEVRPEARLFGAHLDRFLMGVHAALDGLDLIAGAPDPVTARDDWRELELEPFLAGVPERIAAGGAGFPRLELWATDADALALDVRLRPTPVLTRRVALRPTPAPPLVLPWVKGPNIARLAALNRELGAEALLLDPDGRAVEGATTSLLWWRDDVLHAVGTRARVDSITEGIVLGIAEHEGLPTAEARPTLAELAESEVWTVNALHGIRPAVSLDGTPLPAPRARRLARFRNALDDTWQPVLGDADDLDDI